MDILTCLVSPDKDGRFSLGITNSTTVDLELGQELVLGHLAEVQHLGQLEAYALDSDDPPPCKQYGGSPVLFGATNQGGNEPVVQQSAPALFLEENGWNSPGKSDLQQQVDYRWRTGSAAIIPDDKCSPVARIYNVQGEEVSAEELHLMECT